MLALLALPFACIVWLRLVALSMLLRRRAVDPPPEAIPDCDLPRYSILVPLYREAHVVPGLLEALTALDYPPEKLEILFVTESCDPETQHAVRAVFAAPRVEAPPAPSLQCVVVPDGHPRTKPRALNYALELTTGDYVVVYDAEDCPDSRQLREAVAVMRGSRRPVGCVQARLGIYNSSASWLTRQFTIEYGVLFGAILPALSRLDLPVPLGGTSNHLPRAVLDEIGGWDPFNVTEDADLGIRLARAGYSVEVIQSQTGEEAPPGMVPWLRQRTRWLKGWTQTYLVHMREPRRLWRELGTRRFLGLQVLVGSVLLSALLHPWFYVVAFADFARWLESPDGSSIFGGVLGGIGFANLVAGYISAAALGAAAALRLGHRELAAQALLMPVYWLAISLAAYRALAQLASAPHLWEKTAHSPRPGQSCKGPRT